jgi:hypothetical protein
MTLLPNVSLRGASSKGPMPSMTTKPVVVPITAVVEQCRSFAISSIPGVNIELASGLTTKAHDVNMVLSKRFCRAHTGHEGDHADICHLPPFLP